MQEKSFWQKIIEWFKELLNKILRVLFPENILEEMHRGKTGSGSDDTSDEDADEEYRELTEEERRRMMASPVQRMHILFFGRVQGVGFRYQAMYAARNAGLTGWVKNLSDGSVEMEIQGPVEAIDYMFRTLNNGRWIRIEQMEKQIIPLVDGERSFQVKGY